MTLTAKQEAFAQALASGATQADAYRSCYKVGTMKPETIWPAASRIASDCKVAARVAELKGALEAKGLWTREQSVTTLAEIAGDGRAMEKIAAIKELNAMHGFAEPAKLDVRLAVTKIVREIVRSV